MACGKAHAASRGGAIVGMLTEEHPDDDGRPPSRAAILDACGHAAYALGLLGDRRPAVKAALLETLRQREASPNRMWLGCDDALAAWALGPLKVAEAVPVLQEALLWQPPASWTESDDDGPPHWPVYWDLQVPRFVPAALAEIGTPAAREVLESALRLSAAEADRRSGEYLAAVAEALARFPAADHAALVERLLRDPRPQVRGPAVLECLPPQPAARTLLESPRAVGGVVVGCTARRHCPMNRLLPLRKALAAVVGNFSALRAADYALDGRGGTLHRPLGTRPRGSNPGRHRPADAPGRGPRRGYLPLRAGLAGAAITTCFSSCSPPACWPPFRR